MRCPKCSRDTYSKKWGTCTAEGCLLNHSVTRQVLVPVIQIAKANKRDTIVTRGRPRKWANETERKRAQRAKATA